MFGDVWQFLSFSFYAHISIKCPNKAPKWGNPTWASQTKHNIFLSTMGCPPRRYAMGYLD